MVRTQSIVNGTPDAPGPRDHAEAELGMGPAMMPKRLPNCARTTGAMPGPGRFKGRSAVAKGSWQLVARAPH